jgi:hypothetical protein
MADWTLIVAGGALVVSGTSAYATYRLGQKQTDLAERQAGLSERQTELAERQVEMDIERERRASQPAFKINPTAIRNEGGAATWFVYAENVGAVEARGVRMRATMAGSGDIIQVTETFDIPAGDMRAFEVHFSPSHVAQVGTMDDLIDRVAFTVRDRAGNETTRDP